MGIVGRQISKGCWGSWKCIWWIGTHCLSFKFVFSFEPLRLCYTKSHESGTKSHRGVPVKRLTQTGDTILEVLITIVVVSAFLGGAFVATNRSVQGNRHAQERGEAIKIAEGQLEILEAALNASPTPVNNGEVFCLDASDSNAVEKFSDPTVPDLADPNIPDWYPVDCDPEQGRYYVSIKRLDDRDFSVLVRWERVGGGYDQVKLSYRLAVADRRLA